MTTFKLLTTPSRGGTIQIEAFVEKAETIDDGVTLLHCAPSHRYSPNGSHVYDLKCRIYISPEVNGRRDFVLRVKSGKQVATEYHLEMLSKENGLIDGYQFWKVTPAKAYKGSKLLHHKETKLGIRP